MGWKTIYIVFSILFQLVAAGLAYRLMRVTRNRIAWGLIFVALILLAIRTFINKFNVLHDELQYITELTYLLISFLLVVGLWLISPLISSIARSEEALQASEERFRSLVKHMQEGVALHEVVRNTDGAIVDYRIIEVNPAFETILGRPRDTVLNQCASQVYGTGEAPLLDAYARVVETGEPVSFEMHFPPLGMTFSISAFTPGPEQFATVFQDITERKRSEETLRFAQFALDRASDAIFLIDRSARLVYVNDAACSQLGYDRREMLTLAISDFDHSFPGDAWGEVWTRIGDSGSLTIESQQTTRDGGTIPVEISCNFLHHQQQEYVCAFVHDITERKHAEEELRASEERFRTSVDTMLDAFGIFSAIRDADGAIVDFRIEYLNPAGCRLNALSLEEQIYKRLLTLFPGTSENGLFASYCRVVETGEPLILASHLDRGIPERPRPLRVFDIQAVRLRDGIIVSWRDVTERYRIQEQLHAETERLAITLRSIGDGVITTDRTGRVVLMNQVAESLTGWTQLEADGRPLAQVFHIIDEYSRERCESPVERVLQSAAIVALTNHTVLVARDGAEYILNDSGAPIFDPEGNIVGVVLVFRDVTEKRRIERELQQAAKLESLGILAGGIAHDFNNILTAVLGNLSLVRLLAEQDERITTKIAEAERAAFRARDLTQQLLTFSRGGTPLKQVVAITDLLRETTGFALLGSNVRCEVAAADDVWPVEVDPGQISQVIHNLIINANQSMPHGGIITVSVDNVTVAEGAALPLRPGAYVRVTVEDQGIGIPEEVLPNIFDPFFSTKEEGTGLGLSTSYSIIKHHHGCILVESEEDIGATFFVYLPASPAAVLPAALPEEALVPSNGCILVMDDEEIVLETVVAMLEVLGYEVVAVTDGHDAIVQYLEALQAGHPFDAVLLDLTVRGGIGGRGVVEQLRELDPHVLAIVSSGYSNDPIMADFRAYGFAGVIAKPYKVSELSEVIRRVITQAREPISEG